VNTPDDVANAIAGRKPGDRVEVEYYRGNSRRTSSVTLGKRPASLQNSSSQQQSPNGGDSPIPLP
jgi:S1-C subfamily serine protease